MPCQHCGRPIPEDRLLTSGYGDEEVPLSCSVCAAVLARVRRTKIAIAILTILVAILIVLIGLYFGTSP